MGELGKDWLTGGRGNSSQTQPSRKGHKPAQQGQTHPTPPHLMPAVLTGDKWRLGASDGASAAAGSAPPAVAAANAV
jgi:hypothetical protein